MAELMPRMRRRKEELGMRHEESGVWSDVRDRLLAKSRSGGVEPSRDVLERLDADLRAARGRHFDTLGK